MQLVSVGTKALTWRVRGALPGVSLNLGLQACLTKERRAGKAFYTERTEHAKA